MKTRRRRSKVTTLDLRTGTSMFLSEKVKAGWVNPGWGPAAWAAHLRHKAGRCKADHPALAAQYLTWAENVIAASKERERERVSDND